MVMWCMLLMAMPNDRPSSPPWIIEDEASLDGRLRNISYECYRSRQECKLNTDLKTAIRIAQFCTIPMANEMLNQIVFQATRNVQSPVMKFKNAMDMQAFSTNAPLISGLSLF